MPTNGVFVGTKVVPIIDGEPVGCSTDLSLELSSEVIDATCKDNEGARQVLPGQNNWTCNFSALTVYNTDQGVEELVAKWLAKDTVSVSISTGVTGDPLYTGDGYISSLSMSFPLNEVASYDCTIEGTTPLNVAVVPA
jgi:hypothetical protein